MNYTELIYKNPEYYFTAIAVVVGALIRGIKTMKWITPDMLPALAFFFGWAIDGAISNTLFEYSYTGAAITALAGGVAGLASVGGHEALVRTAKGLSPKLGELAEKWLGRAGKEKMRRTSAMIVLLALFGCGCGGALGTAAKAAYAVGDALSILDGAASKAQLYFDRHPSLDNEAAVEDAIDLVRAAVEGEEKDKAVKLYEDMRALLDELGVTSATPPDGGAENEDAPKPEPFELPETL